MFKSRTAIEEAEQHEKMGLSQKLGVLLIASASAVATGYVPSYINLYYTDTVGISMASVGLILMITKITDGITDIIMGMIIDRTFTKLGKARPWVLAGGFGLTLSLVLLFNCPEGLSETEKVFFCAAFYFLVNPIFGTMISVACGTLINLVTPDSKNRGILGVFSAYGTLIPVALIGLVVPRVLSVMNESQQAYTVVTLIFAAIALLSSVVGVVCLKETVTERSEKNITKKQPVSDSLKILVHNKYFVLLAVGTILYNLSAAPVATYYAKYVFKDVGVATIMNLPSLLLIFILPLAVPVIEKIGKRYCIVGGLLSGVVAGIILFISNENLIIFMIGRFISGIGIVPFVVALIPLTGEICDYALYTSGKPMEGTISSAATMGGKIGIGLAAGLSGVMLALSGYISSAADITVNQPESAVFMIRFLAGVYPAIMFGLSSICFWKIDMNKINIKGIQNELKEKGLR